MINTILSNDYSYFILIMALTAIPVGFVAAAESKEKLQTIDVPYITNAGRKGGSSCAASIVNALFKLSRENS